MEKTVQSIVGDSINETVERLKSESDEHLMSLISSWLEEQTSGGLFAASSEDRFKQWLESNLLPQLRQIGENGQEVWEMIQDPSSLLYKERIASIVLTIAVLSGSQRADLLTLIAIVLMAIRTKERK